MDGVPRTVESDLAPARLPRLPRGRVEVEEDGDGVWGTVVVSLREDEEGKDLGVYEGRVENGNFAFEFRGEGGDLDGARVAQAEFTGGYSAAAAISEWVEVQQ